MFTLNLFREMRAGYQCYGSRYWLFPLPVLSFTLACILFAAACASVVYLPLPLMVLVLVEIAIFSTFTFFGR